MGAASVPEPDQDRVEASENRGDPNLRSATEVINYHVVTTDGEMGHIEDFAVDTEEWVIRYAVIDTINWWPSKKVILSPEWISEVKWDNRSVLFDLSKEVIKNAPEYDTSQPIHREYEVRIHDYYGQPHYWTQPSTAGHQNE
jgi:sporulation protein YlmC with PRC-barrel domain